MRQTYEIIEQTVLGETPHSILPLLHNSVFSVAEIFLIIFFSLALIKPNLGKWMGLNAISLQPVMTSWLYLLAKISLFTFLGYFLFAPFYLNKLGPAFPTLILTWSFESFATLAPLCMACIFSHLKWPPQSSSTSSVFKRFFLLLGINLITILLGTVTENYISPMIFDNFKYPWEPLITSVLLTSLLFLAARSQKKARVAELML